MEQSGSSPRSYRGGHVVQIPSLQPCLFYLILLWGFMKDEFESIIGLSEDDAKTVLTKMGIKRIRVTERNGERFMVTMDFNMGRVNLSIKDDKVYRASRG